MGRGMHTSYPKGTPLHIILKDGRILEGKFKDHKSGRILLEDDISVNLSEIRAMSMRKLQVTVSQPGKRKVVFRAKK